MSLKKWLIPGFLIILALAWLLPDLDSESLHVDEGRQISPYVQGVIPSARQLMEQGQPPIDAVIGSLFVQAFGTSVFIARLPSALWAVVAVCAMYFVCRRWMGYVSALVTALVLLVNPIFLFYSQYARPYAITLALFLTGIALSIRSSRSAALGSLVVIAVLPWTRVIEGAVGSFLIAFILSWQWLSEVPKLRGQQRTRFLNGRTLAVTAGSVAVISSSLGVLSVVRLGVGGYVARDFSSAPYRTLLVMWEMARDFGLGLWPWLILCVLIVVAVPFASMKMRVVAASVVALPTTSLLAILFLSSIPVYERYEYFATPVLCLAPLLTSDIAMSRDLRWKSWLPGLVAASLILLEISKAWEVKSQVDFVPYASIARAEANLEMNYLVSSDYVIYEIADTVPEFQAVPNASRFLPWITVLVMDAGPVPSHITLIPPVDVLDLRLRTAGMGDEDRGFEIIELPERNARGLLEVSRSLPEGAAMKTALAALRVSTFENDPDTQKQARSWACELRARDPWPQAINDLDRVFVELKLRPCE